MKTTKQLRETTLNELVETHNLALAFRRLTGAPYLAGRWKRALYHAIAMEGCASSDELQGIRQALKLP